MNLYEMQVAVYEKLDELNSLSVRIHDDKTQQRLRNRRKGAIVDLTYIRECKELQDRLRWSQ